MNVIKGVADGLIHHTCKKIWIFIKLANIEIIRVTKTGQTGMDTTALENKSGETTAYFSSPLVKLHLEVKVGYFTKR